MIQAVVSFASGAAAATFFRSTKEIAVKWLHHYYNRRFEMTIGDTTVKMTGPNFDAETIQDLIKQCIGASGSKVTIVTTSETSGRRRKRTENVTPAETITRAASHATPPASKTVKPHSPGRKKT
jgi:hypothetical protein